MRYWLLTNTTYGTWLPGDDRGSVTSVRDRRTDDPLSIVRFEHDALGTPFEDPMPALRESARGLLKGPPILLRVEHAEPLLDQFQETARYRDWTLHAIAIMANHFHIVVEVEGDPDPAKVLADFKAYASRRLNRLFGKPVSETWWTDKGSKRKRKDEAALQSAVHYVLYEQPYALVIWSPTLGRLV